ncbi:uncharacterized protein LOC124170304 [Ischnura elegans]|uniref:uncharacterized protein LOC124170304 n=1 Tax=Ischnura elegans TaxID=197161 RepID=UPI001ED89B25|nr:uncharacterized protein LOC124170304 [Ischnura elegans]
MIGMNFKPEDRGWNDPPIVNFSETNQSHKKGKLLNKRVAFPINGSNMSPNVGGGYAMQNAPMQNSPVQPPMQTSQGNYAFGGAPGTPGGGDFYPSPRDPYYAQQTPPSQYPQSNPHPQSPFMSSGAVEQPQPIQYHQPNAQPPNSAAGGDEMMRCNESLQNLHAMMNAVPHHMLDDVNQSLRVMESMWRENQLMPEVSDLIYQMSVAIRQGNMNYAESLLSSISTNHFESCREWISGPSTILQAIGSQPGGH